MIRLRLPAALPLAVAALLGLGTATSATAAPPEPAVYLALGDSVAAGVGAGAAGGYVDQLAAELASQRGCGEGRALGCRLELVELAQPGATTASMLVDGGQLDRAVALIEAREATPTPVDDVRLVTLTIGGNDVVGPVAAACADPTTQTCHVTINRQLGQVSSGLDEILGALREAGGSDLTIAVTAYYNPFLPPCPYLAAAPQLAQLAPVVLGGLNGVLRAEAAEAGARVVETAALVGPGQLVGDCLHPNAAGHTAIAGAVGSAIADVELTRPGRGR